MPKKAGLKPAINENPLWQATASLLRQEDMLMRLSRIDDLVHLLDKTVRRAFASEPPPVLYHYTSWNGAEGILSSRQVRHTSWNCTNDKAELTSADEAIVATATNLMKTTMGRGRYLLQKFVTNYQANHVTEVVPRIYLACFSEAPDIENQWQHYACDGHGLCLGFRVLTGEYAPEDGGVVIQLAKVDYTEVSWREKVSAGFRSVCRTFNFFTASSRADQLSADALALTAMYQIAASAATTAKKPNWSAEREWRTLAMLRKGHTIQPQVSRGRTYIQLYLREPGKLLLFEEIIVGKAKDQQRLQDLLSTNGYPHYSATLPRISVRRT